MRMQEGAVQEVHEVKLAPEDAELTAAAVLYYASFTARTLSEYWDVEGFRGLPSNTRQALINLDGMAAIITHGKDLANKLVAHKENPEEHLELNRDDFVLLGMSLETYAQENFAHTEALKKGLIKPADGQQDANDTPDELNQRRAQTERIHDELSPIAELAGESWRAFSDSDHSARLGKLAVIGPQPPLTLIKLPRYLHLIG